MMNFNEQFVFYVNIKAKCARLINRINENGYLFENPWQE